MESAIIVYAAVQELATGRVYLIFINDTGYSWTRAASGRKVRGVFDCLADVFRDMAHSEGQTDTHWLDAFAQFRPEIRELGALHFRDTFQTGLEG
jgi:hypothetical protein